MDSEELFLELSLYLSLKVHSILLCHKINILLLFIAMPSASAFKKAFNLEEGIILSSANSKYELVYVHVDHVQKKLFQEYDYPIELHFRCSSGSIDENILLKLIENNFCRNKNGQIVYSEYGSPYECHFGSPKVKKVAKKKGHDTEHIIEIHSVGRGIRRRDIPTLKAQQKSRSRSNSRSKNKSSSHGKGQGIPQKDLEVKKSHFATSKCAMCKSQILPGEEIAKSKKELNHRGGWSHLECLL